MSIRGRIVETITLKEIYEYSQCPAFYYFMKKSTPVPPSRRLEIQRFIVKKAYFRHTQIEWMTTWRLISNWVSAEVFKDIDMLNDAQVDQGKLLAEHCLEGLRNWFDDVYRKEEGAGYIDVKLSFNIGKFRIEHTAPVIKIAEVPVIINISDVEMGSRALYNDFETRALGWLFAKQMETDVVGINHLSFGPYGHISNSSIELKAKDNAKIEDRLMNVLYCLDKGINYPSITAACESCQFKKICRI